MENGEAQGLLTVVVQEDGTTFVKEVNGSNFAL
jgi:hypothetical protein